MHWALGKEPRVTVKGPGVVDLALRESAEGLALSLFNLTNPMMMKGPIRENYPLAGQTVSVEIPKGKSVAKAWLVVADRAAEFSVKDGRADVNVPGIDPMFYSFYVVDKTSPAAGATAHKGDTITISAHYSFGL